MAGPSHKPSRKGRGAEEEGEEESRRLGDAREEETIGSWRRRRKMIQGINGKNRNTSSGNSIHVARSSSAIAPATGSSRARMAKSNGRAGGRGDEAAAAVGGGSASKAGKRNGSGSRRQSGASMKKKTKKRAGRPKTGSKQVPGLLGIPVARDVDDSDYDDSEDESYSPSSHENSSAEDDDHTATRRSARRGVGQSESASAKATKGRGRTKARGEGGGRRSGGGNNVDRITQLSTEVMLNGVIRPYFGPSSKCALQRTCREMRRLLDAPAAWATLDLRADVIGRRTMKSGRQSIMSSQPLFFLARSVVKQPRFELLRSVDLRGLNLGAMGSTPDLLVNLFDSCRHITTLNLWRTYLEEERLPQPDSAVERVIAERLPGVQHLALEIDSSNKGLKVLLEGCTSLKSLHIGSRRNRRGDSVSMYPNDLGMKAFNTVGAPCLETFALVDKVNIGAAGLRCVLDPSSCPRLRTLIVVKAGRVNDHCLKSIAPSMGRLSSFVLDQCPVKPSTVQFVLESCRELTSLMVVTEHSLLEQPQEGRAILEYLLARAPAALSKVDVQVMAPKGPFSGDCRPRWLVEDASLDAAVLNSSRPRITFGPAVTWDERIALLMAGRRL